MTRRARQRDAGGKDVGGAVDDGANVSLAEAAGILGVEVDALVEALGEHGLVGQQAREARLLVSELETFRKQLRDDNERALAELSALRDVLEDE
jgi:hypothetical protein